MTPLDWLFAHTPITAGGLFLFDSIVCVYAALYMIQKLWRAGGKRRGR